MMKLIVHCGGRFASEYCILPISSFLNHRTFILILHYSHTNIIVNIRNMFHLRRISSPSCLSSEEFKIKYISPLFSPAT